MLVPVERGLYRIAGVDETREQHWIGYTVAMLLFNAAVHKPMPRDDNERQPDWLTFVSMRDSRSKTRATAFLVKAPFSDFELRSLV